MLQKLIDEILESAIHECTTLKEGAQCKRCLQNAGDSKLGIICIKKIHYNLDQDE